MGIFGSLLSQKSQEDLQNPSSDLEEPGQNPDENVHGKETRSDGGDPKPTSKGNITNINIENNYGQVSSNVKQDGHNLFGGNLKNVNSFNSTNVKSTSGSPSGPPSNAVSDFDWLGLRNHYKTKYPHFKNLKTQVEENTYHLNLNDHYVLPTFDVYSTNGVSLANKEVHLKHLFVPSSEGENQENSVLVIGEKHGGKSLLSQYVVYMWGKGIPDIFEGDFGRAMIPLFPELENMEETDSIEKTLLDFLETIYPKKEDKELIIETVISQKSNILLILDGYQSVSKVKTFLGNLRSSIFSSATILVTSTLKTDDEFLKLFTKRVRIVKPSIDVKLKLIQHEIQSKKVIDMFSIQDLEQLQVLHILTILLVLVENVDSDITKEDVIFNSLKHLVRRRIITEHGDENQVDEIVRELGLLCLFEDKRRMTKNTVSKFFFGKENFIINTGILRESYKNYYQVVSDQYFETLKSIFLNSAQKTLKNNEDINNYFLKYLYFDNFTQYKTFLVIDEEDVLCLYLRASSERFLETKDIFLEKKPDDIKLFRNNSLYDLTCSDCRITFSDSDYYGFKAICPESVVQFWNTYLPEKVKTMKTDVVFKSGKSSFTKRVTSEECFQLEKLISFPDELTVLITIKTDMLSTLPSVVSSIGGVTDFDIVHIRQPFSYFETILKKIQKRRNPKILIFKSRKINDEENDHMGSVQTSVTVWDEIKEIEIKCKYLNKAQNLS